MMMAYVSEWELAVLLWVIRRSRYEFLTLVMMKATVRSDYT